MEASFVDEKEEEGSFWLDYDAVLGDRHRPFYVVLRSGRLQAAAAAATRGAAPKKGDCSYPYTLTRTGWLRAFAELL